MVKTNTCSTSEKQYDHTSCVQGDHMSCFMWCYTAFFIPRSTFSHLETMSYIFTDYARVWLLPRTCEGKAFYYYHLAPCPLKRQEVTSFADFVGRDENEATVFSEKQMGYLFCCQTYYEQKKCKINKCIWQSGCILYYCCQARKQLSFFLVLMHSLSKRVAKVAFRSNRCAFLPPLLTCPTQTLGLSHMFFTPQKDFQGRGKRSTAKMDGYNYVFIIIISLIASF